MDSRFMNYVAAFPVLLPRKIATIHYVKDHAKCDGWWGRSVVPPPIRWLLHFCVLLVPDVAVEGFVLGLLAEGEHVGCVPLRV